MPGVVETLRIVYEVDYDDRATKPMAASEQRIQRGVTQTSRVLAQQDANVRRSAGAIATATSRRASAFDRQTRAARGAAAATERDTRALREHATAASRDAAATARAATAASRRRPATASSAPARAPGGVARTAGRVRGGAAGLLGGIGAISAGRFIAAEYTEAARLQGVIAQGIKTTGGAANVSAAHIERMSAAMSRQAGVDDELIGKGASVLLTFTKIRNEAGKGNQVFDRANQAALDLSVRFGKDLTSTSLQVGKALNDPIKGVTALAKAGVQFDEQQKKQIRTMVESGNTLDAQKMILRELETQVGGTARAQAQPVDRLKVAVGDLAETSGRALAPSVEKVAGATADFINQMQTGTGAGGRFAKQAGEIADDLRPVGAALKSVGAFLADHPRLVIGAAGAYAAFKATRGVVKIVDDVRDMRRTILATRDAAAKTRLASLLAKGATGAGGLVKKALSGVKGVVETVMTKAGRRGGEVVADHIASSAGANMGPALDRHEKKFRGGRWSKIGRLAGRAFGIAAAAAAVWHWKDEINKLRDTDWGKIFFKPMKWGEAAGNWLGGLLGTKRKRRGGVVERVRRFQHGGLVPIVASGGEVLVDGGRATMIGGPSDRDATPMLARPGSVVLTADGQARMAAGASMAEAVRSQAPHFAKGGVVPGKYTATAYGPPWGGIQGRGVTATSVNLKGNPRVYGIATDPRMIALGSKVFAHPNPFGYTGRFSAFDTGGAIKGRRIDFYDWRGRKAQNAWGRRQVTISRARIAPRQDGEDTYRARGGGGAETSVSILGRSRRRSGLLSDAFSQGVEAGRAGMTRARIRREGSPILRAIAESIAATGTEPDKGSAAGKAQAPNLGPVGNFKPGSRAVRMAAKAAAIDARRYQYAWGGGHGRIGQPGIGSRHAHNVGKRGLGYDCSGAVSAVLGAGGLLRSPLTSGGLMGWGIKGSGKRLAVRADAGHTIMRIGNRWFGTGKANPQGGAGWLPGNTMKGRGAVRTWPGFRAGGIVGGYRPGGVVATAKQTPAPSSGPALSTGLRRALTFAGGSLEVLDEIIGRSLEQKLLIMRAHLEKQVRRGGPKRVIERLQSAISLIDHELGRRIGSIEAAVEQRSRQGERRRGAGERAMRAQGIEADSARGIGVMATLQARESDDRRANVKSLQDAIGRARKAKQPEKVRELTEQLQDAQDELSESVVRQVELLRDGLRAAAQEGVNAAQHRLSMTQIGAGALEARQRLNRTQETPEGMRERAGYQQGVVLPALAAAVQSAQRQAAMLLSIGDVNGWRQAVQDAASGAVDLANAQADAMELLREAARKAVQNRVDRADFEVSWMQGQGSLLEARERLNGTQGTPEAMRRKAHQLQNAVIPTMQGAIATAEAQVKSFYDAGDVENWHQAVLRLQGATIDLTNAQADAMDLLREAAESAAREIFNLATHDLSMAQTGAAGLEAQQRLNRTRDTPQGMRERAAYQQGVVVPAMEAAWVAAQNRMTTMLSTGNMDGFREAMQDAASAAVDLANAQADAMDLLLEAAARVAQERVDAATHGRTMSASGLRRLEVTQRLDGTYEGAGGAQGRADYIRTHIKPSIQGEIDALIAQQIDAQVAGNTDLVRQLKEQIFDKQTDLLEADLDANQQTAENTNALKDFGGSTAFSYRDQMFTDVDVIRARMGA